MKMKLIYILIACSLIVVPSLLSAGNSPKNQFVTSTFKTNDIHLGYASVWGDGNSSLLTASAENNLRIKIDTETERLNFYIDYNMTCGGLTDEGIISLTISLNGENISTNLVQTPTSKTGSLFVHDIEVSRGDSFVFLIHVFYGNLFPIYYNETKATGVAVFSRENPIDHVTSMRDAVMMTIRRSSLQEPVSAIPEKWDWRDVDGVDWTTPVKDQLQDLCGSCWAFGALSGLEAAMKIWNNDPFEDVDLSEQYLLSCSQGSCGGWYLSFTLRWIKQNGMITEACFPYRADDTIPCEAKCSEYRDYLFGITNYQKIPRDIEQIKTALVTYGPLPASMIVYEDFYPDFDGGVYRHETGGVVFGHCIAIVGYDDTWGGDDEGYWICKNSWGTNWGEEGWFRIAYGECDIESGVYYLEGPNYPPIKPNAPSGTEIGEPGVIYSYSSTASDPEEDDIKYLFDWGDGTDSGWIGPVGSAETITVNHSWDTKGTYTVRVKVKDIYGLESEWSDPLKIRMPRTYISFFADIMKNQVSSIQFILRNDK
ncbi:MAG: C1 family peptidase [Candidatus Thermoplasmatota archaeon]|nr:C1 family peptidase [Candidatus Thermoplasmatota archaeon]